MAKKILVLLGHPRDDSLCAALARRYAEAAGESGAEVRFRAVATMGIDLEPPGVRADAPLAPWVEQAQDDIRWCDHFVVVAPMWWGGVPAPLKAVFDRALLPGFAYKYDKGPMPKKLLTGRSARFILTSDTPSWWLDLVLHRPLLHQMRQQILEFCGFKPVGQTLFSPVRTADAARRKAWLDKVAELGRRGI